MKLFRCRPNMSGNCALGSRAQAVASPEQVHRNTHTFQVVGCETHNAV